MSKEDDPHLRRPDEGPGSSDTAGQPREELLHARDNSPPEDEVWTSVRADRDLETFVDDLRRNRDAVLNSVAAFLHKQNKTRDDLAFGIYLDVALKSAVYGMDPFSGKRPTDEAIQDDRRVIAFMATEWVASQWLAMHPHSQSAHDVLVLNIFASDDSHHAFLQEIWPCILARP